MRLDLSGIAEHPGRTLPFDYTIDLRDLEINFQTPFQKPLAVRGEVRNSAGVMELYATVEGDIEFDCSRCAEHTERVYFLEVEGTLAKELANPDDFANADTLLYGEDGMFDLDEAIRDAMILESDQTFLCREDCKGLCPTCGKNLNDGPCDCERETDPRLSPFRELLEKKRGEEDK